MPTPNEIVRSILVAARKKIANPKNWTKGAFARTMNGRPVNATVYPALAGDDYCQFCAKGALISAATEQSAQEYENMAVNELMAQFPKVEDYGSICKNLSLVNFNDHGVTQHSDVIACFDRAIESVSFAIELEN